MWCGNGDDPKFEVGTICESESRSPAFYDSANGMTAPNRTAGKFPVENPLSRGDFGARVARPQKPLQRLAATEDMSPWQLAFFAGWGSFLRQSENRSNNLQFHSHRSSNTSRVFSPEGCGELPRIERAPTPIFSQRAGPDLAERRRRMIYAALALFGLSLMGCAILLAIH